MTKLLRFVTRDEWLEIERKRTTKELENWRTRPDFLKPAPEPSQADTIQALLEQILIQLRKIP